MSATIASFSPTVAERLLPGSRVGQLYRVRLAASIVDVMSAQRLRFQVFNVELGEGLVESYLNGLDADQFDAVCDHLLVEEVSTGMLVGTYRLQTGEGAMQNEGFYSSQEFDLAPLLAAAGDAGEIVELGRACVHKQHRNLIVLGLLWKGIATYAKERGGRYLIGCSSVNSQHPADGVALYESLRHDFLAPLPWRTLPQVGFECAAKEPLPAPLRPPKLMSAYFSLGARICGPPALDSEFQTIDFLTFLDLHAIPQNIATRYGFC